MSGITGQANTFNLPNFVGPLFLATPTDTPFLSAIGGLTGGKPVTSTTIQWQADDLRAAGQNTVTEGAAAPVADARVRRNITNVLEIHQEAIEVSYTKLAATGQYAGANIAGVNPVQNELDHQIGLKLKEIARDVEFSFLNGQLHVPADNTEARKTGGLLEAIVTNAIAAAGAPLSKDMVDALLLEVYSNGGILEGETATLMVAPAQRVALTKAYVAGGNYRSTDRVVGGVSFSTIETDFGTLNVMTNRHLAADTLAVVSLEECAPAILEVPGKGFLFVEPLAKTGASEKYQVYGEIGLEWGNEHKHGKITGLAA